MTQLQTTMTTFATAEDIVRRGIRKTLPVKLTEPEFTAIARVFAAKMREIRQLEADFEEEKEKRKAQIKEIADEVKKMSQELDSGQQDRSVPCNEVFRRERDERGVETGFIFMIRQDTMAVVEKNPASPSQMQRYLPGTEPAPANDKSRSVLDDARARQAQEEAAAAAAAETASDDVDELPELAADEGGEANEDQPDAPVGLGEGTLVVTEDDAERPGDLDDEQGDSAPPSNSSKRSKKSSATDAPVRFGKGEIVSWQATATEPLKTGEIVLVVPKGKSPSSCGEKYKHLKSVRQHESYVVAVEGDSKLRHPVASQLRAAKEGA